MPALFMHFKALRELTANEGVVAGTMPAILRCLEQALHFRRIQVILRPLVAVGRAALYFSLFDRLLLPPEHPAATAEMMVS